MFPLIKIKEGVIKKHPLLFLYLVFFLIQVFLFLKIGVVSNQEAEVLPVYRTI